MDSDVVVALSIACDANELIFEYAIIVTMENP
jgi:hypothetical protein